MFEEVTPVVFSTTGILDQYIELLDYPISIHEINSLTQCKEASKCFYYTQRIPNSTGEIL